MKEIALYDYQRQMLEQIMVQLQKKSAHRFEKQNGLWRYYGRSIMVQMPTGTGKTYVMAALVQQTDAKGETWIIAHRRELVEQMEQTLDKFGLDYAEAKKVEHWPEAHIRVMSIQWLKRHIERVKTQPSLIIIDEAHHAMAPSYQELWTVFPDAQRVGFTATPCRMQSTDFTKLFDVLLQSWSIDKFIKKGRLSLYDYVVINRFSDEQYTIDSLEKRGADGDFQIKEMDEKMNNLQKISHLYESIERYAPGKRGIVYAINIRHAKNIAEYYTQRGLRAVAIDSKTPSAQRARMVKDFREGMLDCLVNVNLFDEGFDCPDVEYIQMARPTLSLAKYMQMIGRGLRVHPQKKLCILIDNVGLFRMFGRPNASRNWDNMFQGITTGKGQRDALRRRMQHTENRMEIVAHHSRFSDKKKYYDNVEPYEENGRWGLRSGDTIVLSPIYMKIEPFVGNYSDYMLAPNRWGVLMKTGRPCVSPKYKKVDILPDGEAILTLNEIYQERVRLGE